MKRAIGAGMFFVLAAACGGSSGGNANDTSPVTPPPGTDVTPPGTNPGVPDSGTPTLPTGGSVCTAWNEVSTSTGGPWVKMTCPDGQGCVQGACVVNACSDDCELGDVGCQLAGGTIDPARTSDRARLFEKWIKTDTRSLFEGQIASIKYTNETRTTIDDAYIGDSALHTGIYLQAESHRLLATGSFQARKNVRSLVDLFHSLFGVSGDPGMLATSIFPAGDPDIRSYTGWDCTQFDRHCNVSWNGKQWDYVGEPSRDMYIGPMLGLVAAYDALGSFDEDTRKIIRADVMTWAKELVKKRTVPVVLVINGIATPPTMVNARFFIPETADQTNGAVTIDVSTSNLGDARLGGGQDFMPNPSVLLRQISLLSSIPDVPRSTSGLMVGAIINAALHVSEGVPDLAADRAALLDFELHNTDEWGNASSWIDVAAGYASAKHSCTDSYFGNHIAWASAYTWGLLEKDPTTKSALFSKVIDGKMWPDLQTHKNSFFTFGYGAMKGVSGLPLTDGVRQITNFPAPPRVRTKQTGGCVEAAGEIQDRRVQYYQWHSNPWDETDDASAKQTYPGHDYLVAYWLGRTGGEVPDDTGPRCLHE